MSYQPFLIANYKTGIDTDLEPWLIPADAFQNVVNGYIHHGVLSKRQGMNTFGWFVNSPVAATVDNITQADPGVVTMSAIGSIIEGDFFQIRGETGMTEINNTTYQVGTVVGSTFQILDIYGENVDTTSFSAFAGGGSYYPVPRNPIMGIIRFIDSDGDNQIVIFDTARACKYNGTTLVFDPLDTSDIFNASTTASNFVTGTGFGKTAALEASYLYFTNYDGVTAATSSSQMRYWDGTSTTTAAFVPDVDPNGTSEYVNAAHYIFSIRNRLLLLNTIEDSSNGNSGTKFQQRMRWSRQNDARATGNNWDQVTPGNGGFEDAPTSETIVSATQLQDQIIVFFTQSVWSIVPTNDVRRPFRWVKINSYRACGAPYANIPHDRFVISFGQRGIVATDRVDVKRIDDRISTFVQDDVNLDFIQRMFSGRNFQQERSWTLYPSSVSDLSGTESETSDYALIRSEDEGAWSRYTTYTTDLSSSGINMSVVGYGLSVDDKTFADFSGQPDDNFELLSEAWNSYYSKGNAEIFLGGDQTGRVLGLEVDGDDVGKAISFEAVSAAWNPYKDQARQAQLGYVDFYIDADVNGEFQVDFYSDDIENPYKTETISCLPNLGFVASIQDVTLSNPVNIEAGSHGLVTGDQIYIYQLDGAGELEGNLYTITRVDENNFTLDGVDGTSYATYNFGGVVVRRQFSNTKCWKRAYAGGTGSNHYIKITHSGIDQILRFNAFIPWFKPSARMIGGR